MSTPNARDAGQDMYSDLKEVERRAVLAWVGEHLPQVRRSVYEDRLLRRSLVIGFVIGLAAHIGGYLLKTNASQPVGVFADLLYALGWALWTGVVVVVVVEVFPEAKRRGYKRMLDAYEAAQRDQAQTGAAPR